LIAGTCAADGDGESAAAVSVPPAALRKVRRETRVVDRFLISVLVIELSKLEETEETEETEGTDQRGGTEKRRKRKQIGFDSMVSSARS
jgi:hypothetical protein